MWLLQKCDNGSNIKRAWGDLDGHECICHTLQLCVNTFLAHHRIAECVKAMNHISSHFSRSTLGVSKLHEIQTKLGLPKSKPPKTSATRWMGQFNQIVWFVHNAAAITEYDKNVRCPSAVTVPDFPASNLQLLSMITYK